MGLGGGGRCSVCFHVHIFVVLHRALAEGEVQRAMEASRQELTVEDEEDDNDDKEDEDEDEGGHDEF